MAAESALLAAVESFLGGAGLAPAPATIGLAEPAAAPSLPSLVLSLEESSRVGAGVGERVALKTGALQVQQTVDLAALFDKQLTLDRLQLYLPHGGLVRSDGTDDPLRDVDIQIKVNGAAQTLVGGGPIAGQFSVAQQEGRARFGAALPNAPATVDATYYVGQWEQRLVRIRGVLRIDVCAVSINDVRTLGVATTEAMLAARAPGGIVRLLTINVGGMSSIGLPQAEHGNSRRWTLRFPFDFEQEINAPESAGVIHETPVITRLVSASVAPGGVIVETLVQEPPVFP